MTARVSSWHVIWAYADHIRDWRREGMSIEGIRRVLRDEHSLHVAASSVRAVLASYDDLDEP